MVDPILVSVASAVATKAAVGLYDLVRNKFAKNPADSAVLEAAGGASEGSSQIAELAEIIARAEQSDPDFGAALRDEWARISRTGGDGECTNEISGTVSGNAVLAHDIQGNITF